MLLSNAISEFMLDRRAEHLSPHTLDDYANTYKRFMRFIGCDPDISSISHNLIVLFMASTNDVSKKTALNYHTGLSSLYTWMVSRNLVPSNIIRTVPAPKPGRRDIQPFDKSDVVEILKTIEIYPNCKRNNAIALLFLDTGIRSSELCNIRMGDISIFSRHVMVHGKGDVKRLVKFSTITADALIAYLGNRKNATNCYLFLTRYKTPFTPPALTKLFARIGSRAGVLHCHPHRFRHTFAINYLRNGGNIYTLQKLLGHSTLAMVGRYLQISQIDIDRDHDKASPVAHWFSG